MFFEGSLAIIILLIYLFIIFIAIQLTKDINIGNITWIGGCLLLTSFYYVLTLYCAYRYVQLYCPSYTLNMNQILNRQTLITLLTVIWATRLITLFFLRYKKKKNLQVFEQNQSKFYKILVSFIWIFILQGTAILIMSFPAIYIFTFNNLNTIKLNFLDLFGLVLWIIGFAFESISDYQLSQFFKNPENKGKIMKTGLWQYSRHPNYFGEILIWWSFFVIALSIPGGWITIIAPLSITILLTFFTGIPLNEKTFENNPEYEKYKKETSTLIPWFPNKELGEKNGQINSH